MKYPVQIQIKRSRDSDDFLVVTKGSMYYENDTAYIEYSADNLDFVIGVGREVVTINQTSDGRDTYTMVFENGKTFSFDLDCDGLALKCHISDICFASLFADDVIELELAYTLNYNEDAKNSTELYLKCNKI